MSHFTKGNIKASKNLQIVYSTVYSGRLNSGCNPRYLVIINRFIFVIDMSMQVSAVKSTSLLPRRLSVDSLSSFARFSSRHYGKGRSFPDGVGWIAVSSILVKNFELNMTKSKSKSKKSEKGKEVNNSANAGDSRVSKTCEVCLRIRWKRFLLKPPFCMRF